MKTLVVYGGRFQPFHKGHKASYDALVKKFGRDVYVASPDKAIGPSDPFAWSEKQKLAKMMGVPADKFVAPKSVYNKDLIQQVIPFNEKDTVLIVALSQKDGDRLIGKNVDDEGYALKKDGSRAAIQWLDKHDPQPASSGHIYVAVTPTVEFDVAGQPVTGATQIREMYATADSKHREQILLDLYGKVTPALKKLFDKRLGTTSESLVREFNEFINKFRL